jgi:hypothetical protein
VGTARYQGSANFRKLEQSDLLGTKTKVQVAFMTESPAMP